MMGKEVYDSNNEHHRDREVLAELMKLRSDLNHFIFSAIPNRADAEDVFQEVCLKIWSMREDYQLGSEFRAWAFTITRFTILDWRKRYATRRVQYLDAETIELLANQAEEEALDSDQRHASRSALVQCLGQLNDRITKLLRLHYKDRIALVELAKHESTTTSAMKQLFYRARTKLRDCVNARLSAAK